MNIGNVPQVYITVIIVICWYKHHRPGTELGSKLFALDGAQWEHVPHRWRRYSFFLSKAELLKMWGRKIREHGR